MNNSRTPRIHTVTLNAVIGLVSSTQNKVPHLVQGDRVTRRAILLSLCVAAIALFAILVHVDAVYANVGITSQSSSAHALAPVSSIQPAPIVAKTDIQQGGIISTIQNLFNYVINATVYFPAKTFQEAVEKATRNIFTGQLDLLRAPLREVIQVYAFANAAAFGNLAIPSEVRSIGTRLTQAAVPIWVLSLVLLGMAALTRSAVGMGYGSTDIAAEGARWFFIALASGNGASIVNWVHTGFGALTYAIASAGGSVSAGEFVGAFIPSIDAAKGWPILVLVVGAILGLITVVVLAVTYLARYTLLLAITGLAPLCIACEGIPFTRFVFREWLSTFLRLEFLQIINVTVLVIFKAIGFLAAAHGGGVTQAILLITVMLGLSSTLIGINASVFKQVFGTAIDVVAQMRSAGEQMVRVMGQLAGVAVGLASGGAAAPLPALASAGALGANTMGAGTGGDVAQGAQGSAQQESSPNTAGIARALGNATSSPFLRGVADGAWAAMDGQRQRAAAGRVVEQQRQAEQRRAESLAREMGATSSEDIEAISQSITNPSTGRSSEAMTQAHRDNADLLRGMVREYGNPARAAAVGGYPSFAALAVAMAEERFGGAQGEAAQMASTLSAAQLSPQPQPASINVASATSRTEIADQGSSVRPSSGFLPQAPNTQNASDSDEAGRSSLPQLSMPVQQAENHSPISATGEAITNPQQSANLSPTVGDAMPTSQSTRQALPSMGVPQTGVGDQTQQSLPPADSGSSIPPSMINRLPETGISEQSSERSAPSSDQAQIGFGDAASSMPDRSTQPMPSSPASILQPPTASPIAATQTQPFSTQASHFQDMTLPPNEPPSPSNVSLSDWLSQVPPTPIQGWINTPPALTDPGSHNLTPYDFGVGATLAHHTQSSPTHAPLWAQTAHDLRMAFGEQYVTDLLTQTRQQQLGERQLMAQIDAELSRAPAARSVQRFWLPNTH